MLINTIRTYARARTREAHIFLFNKDIALTCEVISMRGVNRAMRSCLNEF